MHQTNFGFAAFLLSVVLFLPGCYFAAGFGEAPWKKQEPPIAVEPTIEAGPTIEAEWSEPVNGVRLAVRQIARNTPADHVLLLVMAHNATDQPIDMPGLRAEPAVHLRQPDGTDEPAGYGSYSNLRVVVEPLERRAHDLMRVQALEMAVDVQPMLEPGETRLHAIRLEDQQTLQYQQLKQQRSTIDVEPVIWPGMSSHDAEGRWRIHLIYRPDGFPTPPSEDRLIERAEPRISDRWKGIEVEVPAIEIDWVPIPGPNDL